MYPEPEDREVTPEGAVVIIAFLIVAAYLVYAALTSVFAPVG